MPYLCGLWRFANAYMQLIKEDEGIKLIKIKNSFYLEYDAGSHMVKKKE